jgi:hypothetical protein
VDYPFRFSSGKPENKIRIDPVNPVYYKMVLW